MKFLSRISVGCLIIVFISGMVAGCSNKDQFETIPQTLAAMTQKAFVILAATNTPEPTEPPTVTPVPSDTPTLTVTPTPDFTDFLKVTPGAAQVNTATWKGVNFKFVKSEVSELTKPLDPNSTTGKEKSYGKGKKTANIYFMADVPALYNKVISTTTYVSVIFSDGTTESQYEGYEKNGGALKAFYASEKTDSIGEVFFVFGVPKEGQEIVQVKIAENKNAKDKAVVLYQK